MSGCAAWEERLSAYADGESAWGEAEAALLHVESCPGCREQMRWLAAMKVGLGEQKAPALPEAARAAMLAVPEGRHRPIYWNGAAATRRRRVAVLVLSLAALAVVVVALRSFWPQLEELPLGWILARPKAVSVPPRALLRRPPPALPLRPL